MPWNKLCIVSLAFTAAVAMLFSMSSARPSGGLSEAERLAKQQEWYEERMQNMYAGENLDPPSVSWEVWEDGTTVKITVKDA